MADIRDIVCILGPTAVGKTAVACAVQDYLASSAAVQDALGYDGVTLISVDSTLVYRGMDIGTAKPTASELLAYPHALIDICDPAEVFSAADFVELADVEVRNAWADNKLPVMVGGTMLYAKRFIEGIAPLPQADPVIRAELAERLQVQGGEALHRELATLDPEAAAGIHPNNPQRLLRALEVIQITGAPMSDQWRNQQDWRARLSHGGSDRSDQGSSRLYSYSIEPEQRSALHQLIAQRFEQMLEDGFLAEVEGLRKRDDLHLDLPSMRAVGYRQAWMYLDGAISAEDFKDQAIVATRRLAKRQMTWLRQWTGLRSLTWGPSERIAEELVGQIRSK